MKYSQKLQTQYREEIQSWNWDKLTFEHVSVEDTYLTAFAGTVIGLLPSGKIYMFWTTNQTAKDVLRDTAWWAALESVLEEKKMWHEGDSGDIFISKVVDDITLQKLWDDFDVPVDANDCIESSFLHFEAGTPREDVWHWFDDAHSVGITELMFK